MKIVPDSNSFSLIDLISKIFMIFNEFPHSCDFSQVLNQLDSCGNKYLYAENTGGTRVVLTA
jgi:hypothetical protein